MRSARRRIPSARKSPWWRIMSRSSGEPLYDRLDADIAFAMMGLNAAKGVEIGAGFASVAQRGSQHGDELTPGASSATTPAASSRHFLGPGHRGVGGDQAHFQHRHRAPFHRPHRQGYRRRHHRPA